MRTVKVEAQHHVGPTIRIFMSTEIILDNDDEAEEEGRRAWAVLTAMLNGIAKMDEN